MLTGNGTNEILNINTISAAKYNYNTITVSWSNPTGYTNEEKWFYKVHARFVQDSTIVTKETDVSKCSITILLS